MQLNNVEGGRIAAQALIKLVGKSGKIIIIAHSAGISTAIDREKGALEIFKKYPKRKPLNTQYANSDISKALRIEQDIISVNLDLKSIFATSEGSSLGVARALEKKKMKFTS